MKKKFINSFCPCAQKNDVGSDPELSMKIFRRPKVGIMIIGYTN